MDLQYHDLRPTKSLAARVGLERIADRRGDRRWPITEPPPDTRAYFRGRCLQRWPESIVAANWDSLVFDVGGDPLRRVPMMEPLRGTQAHVGSLIDECESAADLLEKLGNRTEEPHHGRTRAEEEASAAKSDEVVEDVPAKSEQGEKIKAELDDLLDEIDEVLETNAEDFVKSYVQKGGQ